MSNKKAIIIGAGAGGLSLANILAKAGYQVDIYEKNDTPGGRMGVLKSGGYTFDTGPSWYLMKDVFRDYFKLFGKRTDDYYELARLNPAYKVFYDYREPITITGDYSAIKSSFESVEPGSSAHLDDYLTNAERSYLLALKYFLYNPYTRIRSLIAMEVIKSLPQFISLFARNLHTYVNARFKSLALQQILEYPSVFLGASPFNTPALYQLMSYLDFKEGVYYPKTDGMHAVTNALYLLGQELGVRYHFNSPVTKIMTNNGKAQGVIVGKTRYKADIVISNADLHFTETKLLSKDNQTYPQRYWDKRQAGPSALLLYLGVSGSLPELKHHNLFFTKDWKNNFDSIYAKKAWPEKASVYVSKTTATDTSTAPADHENLFVLVPLPSGKTLPKKQQDVMIDHYIDMIAEQSGCLDLKNRIVFKEIRRPDYFHDQFNAWQSTALGMSHTLKQSAFLRPNIKSKKVTGLYYVGANAQPGIGVPMCLISAQLVYKSLIKDHSAGKLTKIQEIS